MFKSWLDFPIGNWCTEVRNYERAHGQIRVQKKSTTWWTTDVASEEEVWLDSVSSPPLFSCAGIPSGVINPTQNTLIQFFPLAT